MFSPAFFFFFPPLGNFWKYIFSSSENSTNFDEVLEKFAKILIGKKPKFFYIIIYRRKGILLVSLFLFGFVGYYVINSAGGGPRPGGAPGWGRRILAEEIIILPI